MTLSWLLWRMAEVARRPGVVAVSQRLRPMAEQLLAESGDSVADVLAQLLEVCLCSALVQTAHP